MESQDLENSVMQMLIHIWPLHWITLAASNPPSTLISAVALLLDLDDNFCRLQSPNLALKHLGWNQKDFA